MSHKITKIYGQIIIEIISKAYQNIWSMLKSIINFLKVKIGTVYIGCITTVETHLKHILVYTVCKADSFYDDKCVISSQ